MFLKLNSKLINADRIEKVFRSTETLNLTLHYRIYVKIIGEDCMVLDYTNEKESNAIYAKLEQTIKGSYGLVELV